MQERHRHEAEIGAIIHLFALKVSAHGGEDIHRHLLVVNALGCARNSGNRVIRTEASSHTVYFQFESVEARCNREPGPIIFVAAADHLTQAMTVVSMCVNAAGKLVVHRCS